MRDRGGIRGSSGFAARGGAGMASQERLETWAWDSITFGVEVRRLRKKRGVKLEAIVEALGMSHKSRSAGWRLEWGLRGTCPGPKAMTGLAEALGVPVTHLLLAAGYAIACGCKDCKSGKD